MLPGIQLLQGGKRRSFRYTAKALLTCCEANDPRMHGCGYTGLCRTLFDQRDDDWEWWKRFNSGRWWKFSPRPTPISSWLEHSIPTMPSQKEGAM